MAKPKPFNDPFLNEFVYDCLWNAFKDQRVNLKLRENKALKSASTARSFATKSTFEEKITLLARLGIPFFFGFGTMDSKVLADLHRTYKENKLLDAVNELLARKIFVVTQKEVAMYMSLMAASVHSDSYVINRDYIKMGYHINAWKKDVVEPSDAVTKDALHSAREISRVMIQTVMLPKYIEEYGINEVGLTVMLFLFTKNRYDTPVQDIKDLLIPMYSPSKVTNAIKKCIEKQFMAKSLREKKQVRYTLTGLGVETAMRIQHKVMNLATRF